MNDYNKEKPLLLDVERQSIELNGLVIYLCRTQYRLLYYLISHNHRPISRNELSQYVWGNGNWGRRDLDKNISKLRKYLGDNDHKVIVTIHGMGYMFSGCVNMSSESEISQMRNTFDKTSVLK
ncbi:winged helix-turn-helix domain-containing protein [Alicyclobacillus fastidiosus]|uniref:winged helix-turn-helix domain-containing protein n=1 Tax=Alicyclobacillus fastidiosus TaxID=392011 RepID=UPI0034D4F2E7